nr:MAG TPA: hypothetical protein [Caudoviricetes sp.]
MFCIFSIYPYFHFHPPKFLIVFPTSAICYLLTSTKWFYPGSIIFNKNSYF